jgi:hypothetical protein
MRRAGQAVSVEDIKNAYNIFFRKPEGKNHSEEVGVNRKIILEWMLGK